MPAIILKSILPDAQALATETADIFARLAVAAIEARERFLVCLCGGDTLLPAYQLLTTAAYRDLPWQKTYFFWGEERSVPPDNPYSNYNQAYQHFLSRVPVLKKNILRMQTELPVDMAISDYTQTLIQFSLTQRPWPRFDLLLMSLGEDGHIASVSPGSPGLQPDSPPVIATQLEYKQRPVDRISLGLPVINSAREVLILVSGPAKSAALTAAWDDNSDPQQNPAKLVQPSPGIVRWLVDQAAAGE